MRVINKVLMLLIALVLIIVGHCLVCNTGKAAQMPKQRNRKQNVM